MKSSFFPKAQAYKGCKHCHLTHRSERYLLSVPFPCQPSLTSLCVPLKPQHSYELEILVHWIEPVRAWHSSANTVHKVLWTYRAFQVETETTKPMPSPPWACSSGCGKLEIYPSSSWARKATVSIWACFSENKKLLQKRSSKHKPSILTFYRILGIPGHIGCCR